MYTPNTAAASNSPIQKKMQQSDSTDISDQPKKVRWVKMQLKDEPRKPISKQERDKEIKDCLEWLMK